MMNAILSPKSLIRAVHAAAVFCAVSFSASPASAQDAGFVSLFNGKDLSGWTAAKEDETCFTVEDGVLVVKGGRSHLFYSGDVAGADFKNFEIKLKVRTTSNSNGGVYFHTKYQDEGWPDFGYECQVNSTHKDPKKTGSLYAVVNCFVPMKGEVPTQKQPYAMVDHKAGVNLVMEKAPSTDDKWFDYHITVKDNRITIKVDGVITVDYLEPKGAQPNAKMPGRKLSSGTFALQAHDPDSVTYYKSIEVKILD